MKPRSRSPCHAPARVRESAPSLRRAKRRPTRVLGSWKGSEAKAEGQPVARHGERERLRIELAPSIRQRPNQSWIQRMRSHDPLVVPQLEELLDGFSVASRGRHIGNSARVCAAEAREEDDGSWRRTTIWQARTWSPHGRRVAAVVLDLLPLDPSVACDENVNVIVLGHDEILGAEFRSSPTDARRVRRLFYHRQRRVLLARCGRFPEPTRLSLAQ